ncbi:MAG: type 4a pilus biogenesis protein PilO [Elusimicrobia bacterium]|nr:type 4a pilus biogenesis protein PilO [Elusimicrobiota bacterium]
MAEKKKTQITQQQKIVLGILGAVGLFMLYSKVYAPLGGKIKAAEDELSAKQAKLADMRKKANRLDKLEKEYRDLEDLLKEIEKRLPKDNEVPALIKTITDTAQKYNMEVRTFKESAASEKSLIKSDKFYEPYPYDMEFTADYHTLGAFFTEIARLERIFNIGKMDMVPVKNSEKDVQVKFTLVTYTFKE